MKRILRTVAFLFVSAGLSGSAWALDFGVDVHEVPVFLGGGTNIAIESFSSVLWATAPVAGTDFKLETTASGSFTVVNGTFAWTDPTIDLTTLSFSGITPVDQGRSGVVSWTAGRHAETDLTGGWVISSPWDGFNLGWQTGPYRISGAAGYSGLILKGNARDGISASDRAALTDNSVTFGPRRVLGLAGFSWNEAFWRQDAAVEFLGQADLGGSGPLHSAYGSFQVSGNLPGGIRQRTFGSTDAALSDGVWTFGSLAGLEFTATLPFLGSRIVSTAVWGGGTVGTGFQTVSGNGLADVVSLTTAHGAALKVD
jgi:hypothetical protein